MVQDKTEEKNIAIDKERMWKKFSLAVYLNNSDKRCWIIRTTVIPC